MKNARRLKSNMEKPWFTFYSCLIIFSFQLCNGLPIPTEKATTTTDPGLQVISSLIALCLTLSTLVFIAGCLCCYGRNGFKEFHDTPITLSGNNCADNGLVNPTADGAFTIFTPISQNLAGSNKFLLDEHYVFGEINVASWFNEGEQDFPRCQLKYIKELGKGWFGKVVQGTAKIINKNNVNNDDGMSWCPVVVRILDSTASTKERVHFLHDANIYKCGEHTNILKLYGRCLESVPYLLLQEFCPQGDLKTYLISNKTANSTNLLASEYPLIWCCQLTSALKFLHDFGLAHSDLACRNCQLTSNLTLKLGDYGLSYSKYPEDYYEGGGNGGVDQISTISVRWCAPESIKYTSSTIQLERITREANIWSLGVCFWEICECGSRPYEGLTDDEVISDVLGKSNVRLARPTNAVLYTDYIYHLMQSCWSTLESRPTANQIYLTLTDLLQVFTQFNAEKSQQNAQESFDSRWNSLKPNNNTPKNTSEFEFVLNEPEPEPDSFDDSKMQRSSSSETEDENWKTKIERGVYSEKVRQKSRSVADLMILTHIDCSESENETPFESLTECRALGASSSGAASGVHYKNVRLAPRNLEKISQIHGSEGNLLNVENDFEVELRKLHEEHKDSLIFLPDPSPPIHTTSRLNERLKELSSTTDSLEPKNQIYNVFNVKIQSNLSPVHVTLNEIIKLNEVERSNYEVPKLCDIIENNSNINDFHGNSLENCGKTDVENGIFKENDEKLNPDEIEMNESECERKNETEMFVGEKSDENTSDRENVEISRHLGEKLFGNGEEAIPVEKFVGVVQENLSKTGENSFLSDIVKNNCDVEHFEDNNEKSQIEIFSKKNQENSLCEKMYEEKSEFEECDDCKKVENGLNNEFSPSSEEKIEISNENLEDIKKNFHENSDKTEENSRHFCSIKGNCEMENSKFCGKNENCERIGKKSISNVDSEESEENSSHVNVDGKRTESSDNCDKMENGEKLEGTYENIENEKNSIQNIVEENGIFLKFDNFHENCEDTVKNSLHSSHSESLDQNEISKKNDEKPSPKKETDAKNQENLEPSRNSEEKIEQQTISIENLIEDNLENEKFAGNMNLEVPEKNTLKTESKNFACQPEKLYQVPKLIELIENNDTLMDYIIANYESELHEDLSLAENSFNNVTTTLKNSNQNVENPPNLDYSLETWNDFLGDAIDTQNKIGDQTFVFETLDVDDEQPSCSFSFYENATPPNSDVNSLEEENVGGNQENGSWESNQGWFLHPQSSCDVSGQLTEQREKLNVKFGMDDEILALLRGELLAKLPHAQGNQDKKQLQTEIYETSEEEADDTFSVYKIYNTPLSPIPEESEDENEGSETCTTPKSPDSGASDDWPEKFFEKHPDQDDNDEGDNGGDENDNSRSLKTQQMFFQNSQDSCCSNDTLFNFEDMTLCVVENDDEDIKNGAITSPRITENDNSVVDCIEFPNEPDYVNVNNDTFEVVQNGEKGDDIDDVSDEGTLEEQDEMFKVLTDIRFSGPSGESHLMSTSFSESNNEQDWDSGSDTRSTSSSGEFIWKEGEHEESLKALKALPQDTGENDYEKKDVKREIESSEESNGSDEDGECPEFIPSAWDKHALPTKSAMRSPEKTLEREDKKKGVWFKKQRYHCVYEYPKEPESPVLQSFDLWNNPPAVTSYPDWYFDIDGTEEIKGCPSIKHDTDFTSTCFNEEFLVTSSSTPFDMMVATRGGSQFFPGFNNNTGKLDENNTTPDSGIETTPESYETDLIPKLPTLKKLAEDAHNKFQQQKIKYRTNDTATTTEILGGLRHTRDKLKLNLPPSSPNTATFLGSKNQFSYDTDIERAPPSFTTFGKSRFSVQQINDVDIDGKNVCFEALPHKPPTIRSINCDIKKKEEKGEASVLDSADEDSGIESSTLERKSEIS